MDNQTVNTMQDNFFELFSSFSKKNDKSSKSFLIKKKRVLIGSSLTCDIVIDHKNVSPIHAVLEIDEEQGKAQVYDMNSEGGTFFNEKKVLVATLHLEDKINFAGVEFIFRRFKEEDVLPPILDMLDPVTPKNLSAGGQDMPPLQGVISKSLPKSSKLPASLQSLPPSTPKVDPAPKGPKDLKDDLSLDRPSYSSKHLSKNVANVTEEKVSYPLAADPKADACEYIFEDVHTLYPIFNYQHGKKAVEIITLFQGKILQIDFYPIKDGVINLVGKPTQAKNQVEFPQIGIKEKIPLINIHQGEVLLHPISGFDIFNLNDVKVQTHKNHQGENDIVIKSHDIVRLKNNDIQIYVRQTEEPPLVAPAPVFRRDPEFKKYLMLCLFIVILLTVVFNLIHVDKSLDEEKEPERVVTILYKKEIPVVKEKSPPVKVAEVENKQPVQKEIEKIPPKVEPKEAPPIPQAKEKQNENQPVRRGGDKLAKAQVNKIPKASNNKIGGSVSGSPNNKPSSTAPTPPSETPSVAGTSNGHVDTYKSANFASTVSSLLAKGGGAKGAASANPTGNAASFGVTGTAVGGGKDAVAQLAKADHNVGSLAGATTGKLVSGKGVDGVSPKKGVYTAGVPTRTVILGSIDPDVVKGLLRDHRPQFNFCYQRLIDDGQQAFEGSIILNFVIGASGHVVNAAVENADSFPADVKGCILNILKGIQFPAPKGGGRAEIRQTMSLNKVQN